MVTQNRLDKGWTFIIVRLNFYGISRTEGKRVFLMNIQRNCSTYDPCGPHGYCEDHDDGRTTCDCKFWWNGTYCDQMTSSGVQIISLGVIVGVLMVIYYGLILRYTFKSKKSTKFLGPEDNASKGKATISLKSLMKINASQKQMLVGISTFIIAFLALLLKWLMIQRIHHDMVDKVIRNLPLNYERPSICHVFSYQHLNLVLFPMSCIVIFLLIIDGNRTSLKRHRCNPRTSLPIPLDFFTCHNRKFVAMTFAVCADELLGIVNQVIFSDDTSNSGIILTYLQQVLQVLAMGFRYYPILAAVYQRSIFSLILGTVYVWVEFPISIIEQSLCQANFYSSDIEILFDYYGRGASLIIIQLCSDLPRYICLSYITVKITAMLFETVLQRRRELLKTLIWTTEEQVLLDIAEPLSMEMRYVKNLFRRTTSSQPSKHLLARLIPTRIYQWRDDFRFSSRVVSVYSSIFLLLYFLLIQICVHVLPYVNVFEKLLQEILDGFIVQSHSIPHLIRPFSISVSCAMLITIVQLFVLLAGIRRNLLQVFRGDSTEIPRRQTKQSVNYAIGNFHFAGYLIGYVFWGLILIFFWSFLLFIGIDAFITFGGIHYIEQALKIAIPAILFYLFKEYLNKVLARFIFLQNNGESLAINNRRILMIFIYFNFFLDAFLGLISSILRLLQSLIGGVIYMARLDYSPLGRKLETFDGGFSAYCGFIHTECTHRHPILLVFVAHLMVATSKNYKPIHFGAFMDDAMRITDDENQLAERQQRRQRHQRKWRLITFLLLNPSIAFFRKTYLKRSQPTVLPAVVRDTSSC